MLTTTYDTLTGATYRVEFAHGYTFVTRTQGRHPVQGGDWPSGMTVTCDQVTHTTPRTGGTGLRIIGGRFDGTVTSPATLRGNVDAAS